MLNIYEIEKDYAGLITTADKLLAIPPIAKSGLSARIKKIRENSNYLISIGACATAGGIQALRNFSNVDDWIKDLYAKPDIIDSLKTSSKVVPNLLYKMTLKNLSRHL